MRGSWYSIEGLELRSWAGTSFEGSTRSWGSSATSSDWPRSWMSKRGQGSNKVLSPSSYLMILWSSRATRWCILTSSSLLPRPIKTEPGCWRISPLRLTIGWTKWNPSPWSLQYLPVKELISTWPSRRVWILRSFASSWPGWGKSTLIVDSVPCKTTLMYTGQSKQPSWWLTLTSQ